MWPWTVARKSWQQQAAFLCIEKALMYEAPTPVPNISKFVNGCYNFLRWVSDIAFINETRAAMSKKTSATNVITLYC